jgi:hypothetical protein
VVWPDVYDFLVRVDAAFDIPQGKVVEIFVISIKTFRFFFRAISMWEVGEELSQYFRQIPSSIQQPLVVSEHIKVVKIALR